MQQTYTLYFLIGLACSLGITLLAFEHYWEEKAPIVWDIVALDDYEENQQLPPIPEENGLSVKSRATMNQEAPKPKIAKPLIEEIHESNKNIQGKEEEKFICIHPIYPHASPIGGMEALFEYLKSNLHYPKAALEHQIEGKVFLSFTVDTLGSLKNITLIRGLGYGCDEEALRLFKNCPIKWKPATRRGKPFEEKFTFPVRFRLKNKKTQAKN